MVLAGKNSYRKEIESHLAFDESRRLYRLRFPALGTACSVLFATQERAAAIRFAEVAVAWESGIHCMTRRRGPRRARQAESETIFDLGNAAAGFRVAAGRDGGCV